MVNQINNNRSGHYSSGVKDSFKNAGKLGQEEGSSDLADDSKIDSAKDNIAALKETIMGSKEVLGGHRANSVTHDFDDFEKSFL